MKRIKHFFFLLILAVITNSCEENGIIFPPSNNNGVFEVTIIGGETFSTTEANFITDNDNIVITAIKTDTDETFTLAIESFDIGTFSFEGVNNIATYIKNDPISAGVWSTFGETVSKGNVEFTAINYTDNTVSGRFNFSAKNSATNSSKAFTEGEFTNIPISTQPVSKDSFTAKVDGVVYEEISLFATPITIGSTNLISITANRSFSENINFNLNENITSGEYDFGSFITQSYPTGQYVVGGNIYVADGKITITSHDTNAKKIAGTFNFDATPVTSATPVHSITEGSFNVSY